MRSDGRENAAEEEKDHIFTAVGTGCHGVKKYQYLCRGSRIAADKEMNEGCLRNGKSNFTDLELGAVLRSDLGGNELL